MTVGQPRQDGVADRPPWMRRATLLAAGSVTVMSGATISPSLPALYGHFQAVAGAEILTRLVLTAPALSIALMAPLIGFLIDRSGRKKLLMVATLSYALAGASGLVLDTLYGILVGRALLGMAVAGVMTTTTTLIGDYFSGDARARFMGYQSSFMAFGGVAFLSVGGFLADVHWRGPFAVYLLAIALLPFMAFALTEPVVPRRRESQAAGARPPLARIGLIYAVAAANMIAFYMIPVQLPFYLHELGVTEPSRAGLAMAFAMLVAAIASTFYGWAKARLGHQAIYALVFATIAGGFGFLTAADSYAEVVAALALAGLGMGINMPNSSVWLLALAPPGLRGRVVGGLATSIFLGQFASPLITQPIIASSGLAFAYGCAAALMVVMSGGFLFAVVRLRSAG